MKIFEMKYIYYKWNTATWIYTHTNTHKSASEKYPSKLYIYRYKNGNHNLKPKRIINETNIQNKTYTNYDSKKKIKIKRFHDEEHANLLNSMWLTAITFLCVGYGDIVPNTYCGRGITLTCGMVVSIPPKKKNKPKQYPPPKTKNLSKCQAIKSINSPKKNNTPFMILPEKKKNYNI